MGLAVGQVDGFGFSEAQEASSTAVTIMKSLCWFLLISKNPPNAELDEVSGPCFTVDELVSVFVKTPPGQFTHSPIQMGARSSPILI